MRHALQLVTALSAFALLAGCDPDAAAPTGGGSGGGSTASVRLLPAGSAAKLAEHLAAGQALSSGGDLVSQRLVGAPAVFVGAESMAGAPSAGGSGTSGGMATDSSGGVMAGDSSTPADDGLNNVQVAGVEEPDFVKSDGAYLYVAQQPDLWIYPVPVAIAGAGGSTESSTVESGSALSEPAPRMRFPRDGIELKLDVDGIVADVFVPAPDGSETPPPAMIARFALDSATPGATALSPLLLTGSTGYMSQLKLLLSGGDAPRLVAMGQSSYHWAWDSWFVRRPYSESQETRLWIFDVSDPLANPEPTTLTLKGELVDSRRIDNHLYLVTRYSPTPGTDPLLPVFEVAGAARPLLNAADCLLPESSNGFPSLTMVVAVDLVDPAATHASCYAGDVYTMYMSRDALYLAATRYNESFDWDVGIGGAGGAVAGGTATTSPDAITGTGVAPVDTLVHRFALNNGNPQYTGSGAVPGGFTGWLGTGSHPQWRFHERDGRLFLVTSWWDTRNLNHHLSVLSADDDGDLVVRASLPNAARPQAIGKPREDIFAIRYVGDRAYVVTFLRTDPLYVLDLADPLDPRVAGELELPGFSAYLHPMGEDWLLGIGRGALGGIEANLFDVRDAENPRVQVNLPICASCEAPLLTDYHAIAVQRLADGITRVALPLQSWEMADELSWRPQELAALMEVRRDDGQLRFVGIQAPSAEYTALARVLLIADAVFQPQNGAVSYASWPLPVAL